MLSLPEEILDMLSPYSKLFSSRVWRRVQELVAGAILCRHQRTVCAVLRVLGYDKKTNFCSYHRVLSKAKWCGRQAARCLFNELLNHFLGEGPIYIGVDETLERRGGKKIHSRGLYHDSVRSFAPRKTRSMGLRWVSLMLITSVSGSSRHWALPFFTALVHSRRGAKYFKKRYKSCVDVARQMILCLSRWIKDKRVYLLGDGYYARMELGHLCNRLNWHLIARLRQDARLHDFLPETWQGIGRPPTKGPRLPNPRQVAADPDTPWKTVSFSSGILPVRTMQYYSRTLLWYKRGDEPLPIQLVLFYFPGFSPRVDVLLCTDLSLDPLEIIEFYHRRWSIEVTFEEARAHLGVETQRQWSPNAIQRTTPALLGLFSMITLLATKASSKKKIKPRQAAWYPKLEVTFSDFIAYARHLIWHENYLVHSTSGVDSTKSKQHQWQDLLYRLVQAA